MAKVLSAVAMVAEEVEALRKRLAGEIINVVKSDIFGSVSGYGGTPAPILSQCCLHP
jgi:hypothetical protein